MHRTRWTLLLLALVAVAVARSMAGTRLDAPTADEPWHAVAGVEYARTGMYRLNPEHPPLVKRWVGALMPAAFTLRAPEPLTEKSAERDMVEETWYHDNDFRAAHEAARRATYLLSALMLLGVGLLAWRALGPAWAAGLLAFLAIEPTFSAHMPLVMTDLPLALTLLMAALAAGIACTTWQWRWMIGLGVTLGLAFAAKHSALPGMLGLAAFSIVAAFVVADPDDAPQARWRLALVRSGKLVVAALVAVAVLWAWYGFQFHAAPDGSDPFNRDIAAKIAELASPLQRAVIGFVDRHHLLPRSYLWGLTDTIRAGLEGRGQNEEFLWGRVVQGSPPWYTWPSYIVIKVPLALIALSLAGGVAVWRMPRSRTVTVTLVALCAMAGAHLAALMRAQGTYAGVRHALPVVALMGVLAAATVAIAWRQRSKGWGAMAGIGLLATVVMTLGEPRLYEYHNELVGGTANAGRWFDNEGLDLGQRAYEIAAYHDSVIAPSGLPLFSASYWLPHEAATALGINVRRRVEILEDSNRAGRYTGFFLYQPTDLLPFPNWDWDPEVALAGLDRVARMGNVIVYRGTQTVPDVRAGGMLDRVMRYIYSEGGTDWALVAERLEEVIAVRPYHFTAALELGNAYLRLGRRDDALRAYRTPLAHLDRGIMGPESVAQFREQIARLDGGDPLDQVPLLRNPWLE